ncbi:hypothetical protein [Rhizobium rhizogenes]|uniref:hypothetical protein n=1 Tax=Rhizobium rhizogenes TaxID=359 RepID=UPI0015724958|nr:hypothetical protein [Rhizobium rhizogenes]NTF72819.1 hypothetical protein [Rhizobium rhizogenes]
MLRGFVFALIISGGAVSASPEIAFAGSYTGHWLRVITADGEEPDPKDNEGCAAFLRSGEYDPDVTATANLTITPDRMETNEEGSDVTGAVVFGQTKAGRTPFSIKAEHEYSVVNRKGFIEQHDSDYISITVHDVQIDENGSVGDVVMRYCRQP